MNSESGPNRRIYLDNAATSWPKPAVVTDAIVHYYENLGVAAGRGTSAIAAEVDRSVADCRAAVGGLIGCRADQVVFCFNGTDALNLALHGLIQDGDEVVTTSIEHNSVLRPLTALQKAGRIKLSIVGSPGGIVDLPAITEAITSQTRLCCVSHASNVTGLIQPLEPIAQRCQSTDTLLVVDAAQTLGHIPVDFSELAPDVLCGSGHKGLLGPLGTGLLAVNERAQRLMQPTRLGGTGTSSESLDQPTQWPHRMEPGNLNVGGIYGLAAAIEFLVAHGIEEVARHEEHVKSEILRRMRNWDAIEVHGNLDAAGTGVISFNVCGQDSHTVASVLDSVHGIEVRAGLHCAPLAHKDIGASEYGGTIRVSPGIFTAENDLQHFLNCLEDLIHTFV